MDDGHDRKIRWLTEKRNTNDVDKKRDLWTRGTRRTSYIMHITETLFLYISSVRSNIIEIGLPAVDKSIAYNSRARPVWISSGK